MEFVAMNGISYLSLDEELLGLMFQAGFSHLNLALVSSDKTVRETTKRPHTLEAYLKVVHKAVQLGFKIVSYQILGLPNETLDSMIQTLAFNARLPLLLGASPFYRTPASPIARGLDLTKEDYVKARLTAMAVETDEFRREDIYTLFITTRIINFLKGLRLSASTGMDALLDCSWSDDRTRIGFALLRLLRETNRLYFWTTKGLRENEKFEPEIFFRVLQQAGIIGCQNGQRIVVGEFSGSGASEQLSQPMAAHAG
jgi:radical SAM superfamily enzyme